MKYMIERHFHVHAVFSESGWKHAPTPILFNNDQYIPCPYPTVVMHKNPYHSMVSWHRYWHLRRKKFAPPKLLSDFIRCPLIVTDLTKPAAPSLKFSTPIDYWNQYYWSYHSLDAGSHPVVHCRYEDLIEDPKHVLTVLSQRLGLMAITETKSIRLPNKRMSTMNDAPSVERPPEALFLDAIDLDYVSQRRYMDEFDVRDCAWMADQLDVEVVTMCDYSDYVTQEIGTSGAV